MQTVGCMHAVDIGVDRLQAEWRKHLCCHVY